MDFLNNVNNVVKSSNAMLKERLNNPFGNKQQSKQDSEEQLPTTSGTTEASPAATTYADSESTRASTTTTTSRGSKSEATGGGGGEGGEDGKNSRFSAIAADAEAVTQNAVKGAKNIGNFLFSMGNKAGQMVTETAKQVKQTVENTSIFTDLTREQQEFVKEHGGQVQAGELPWENCGGDEAKAFSIKEQILTLSQDKRNFVRSPPSDSNFKFDPQQYYPVALSLLKEDPNLGKMRFELVPKLVNEDTFWTNYFYRVSLLKQMSVEAESGESKRKGWSSSRSSSGEGPDEMSSAVKDETSQLGEVSPSPLSATIASAQQNSFNLPPTDFTSQEPTTATLTNMTQLESDESRKLVAEADDLKSKLRELNIGSFEGNEG